MEMFGQHVILWMGCDFTAGKGRKVCQNQFAICCLKTLRKLWCTALGSSISAFIQRPPRFQWVMRMYICKLVPTVLGIENDTLFHIYTKEDNIKSYTYS